MPPWEKHLRRTPRGRYLAVAVPVTRYSPIAALETGFGVWSVVSLYPIPHAMYMAHAIGTRCSDGTRHSTRHSFVRHPIAKNSLDERNRHTHGNHHHPKAEFMCTRVCAHRLYNHVYDTSLLGIGGSMYCGGIVAFITKFSTVFTIF